MDRPGPEGGLGTDLAAEHASSPRPPTPAPCRGLRGPLRCLGLPRAVQGCTRYSTHPVPTRIPTQYTHPAPSTVPHGSHVTAGTVRVTSGTCTYDRFGHPVGEPGGSRTHTGFRVPGRLYTVIYRIRGLHGRLTEFYDCFTMFLLSLGPFLLSLGHVY